MNDPFDTTFSLSEERALDVKLAVKFLGWKVRECTGSMAGYFTYERPIENCWDFDCGWGELGPLPHFSSSPGELSRLLDQLGDYELSTKSKDDNWTVRLRFRNEYYTSSGNSREAATCRALVQIPWCSNHLRNQPARAKIRALQEEIAKLESKLLPEQGGHL
jgi:hypothetical protein